MKQLLLPMSLLIWPPLKVLNDHCLPLNYREAEGQWSHTNFIGWFFYSPHRVWSPPTQAKPLYSVSLHWLSQDATVILHHSCPKTETQSRKTGIWHHLSILWASQVALVVKNLLTNAGDLGDMSLIHKSGISPRGRHANPLQYSCLENPMDRGAWWATVQGSQRVRQDWSSLARQHLYTCSLIRGN